jgi:MFS family permease
VQLTPKEKEKIMNWLRNNTTNLQKMYVIRAFRSGMFSMAIVALFFKQNGLSLKEIMFLQSLFAIAVIVLEVPTGHFADHRGRRISIIIGTIFSVIGYSAYAVSSGFSGFLVGEMLLAVGYSFVSGADSAVIYENADVSNGQGGAIKAEGNGASVGMLAEAITSFIGGSFLSLVSLRFPIYFDVLLALAVLPVALALDEEKVKIQCRENKILKVIKLLKFSLHDHKEIKWLIFYSAAVSSATLTMVWLIPMFFMATKTPTFMFGALWALFLVISAGVSYKAHSIEEFLGRKKSLIVLFVLPILGYLLLGFSMNIITIIFIPLFYVARGLNNPITKSYINGLISSEDRATILSAQSLMGRLPFVFIGPLAGWVNDIYSLQAALLLCGGIFAIMGVIALLFLHKHKAL